MNCILRGNPGSGFAASHQLFCVRPVNGQHCDEDATCHLYIGYHCGNYCKTHAVELAKGRGGTEITDKIYTITETKGDEG